MGTRGISDGANEPIALRIVMFRYKKSDPSGRFFIESFKLLILAPHAISFQDHRIYVQLAT